MKKFSNEDFAHLHVHNEYSFQDGFGSSEAYCTAAKEMGFLAIGLTNHGGVEGLIKHQQAAEEAGIQPVLGSEMYIVPDCLVKKKDEKRYHITVLAKDFTGWKNLMKLTTEANILGFYRKPRIDPALLIAHAEGLIILTGCTSSFINMPGGEELVNELRDLVDVYLEVMPVDMPEQKALNIKLLSICKKTGLPLVLTNDCHYVKKEQSVLQEVLLAMQSKKKWKDPKRWKFSIDDLYLKSAQEMFDSTTKLGVLPRRAILDGMANTLKIAVSCTLRVNQIDVQLPKVDIAGYENLDDDAKLIELTMDGLETRVQQHSYIIKDYDAYIDRIEEELVTITNLGFARYFLVVWDLIKWCKENDVMAGPGRGSVGGSLVAYCLEITMVDPILLGLMFARFISPARIDLPDIDMDFEDIKRGKVRKHLEDVYGKHNVIGLSTFGKMNGRSAIRDVARVFDVPLQDVGMATKSIVVRSVGDFRASYTIKDAFEAFEDGKIFKEKYPRVANIAIDMEGTVTRTGKHAAAMCVSDTDLRSGKNAALVMRTKEIMCCWDKYDAEYMGMMKLDVLGLNALTVLAESKKLIKARRDVDIDYEKLPLDDAEVYKLISAGSTKGIFQFSGSTVSKLVREIGVEDFEELTAVNALNRPGCLRAGMTKDYRQYKWGEKPQPKQHPIIERITKETRGIVLYQEQIMQILCDLAGLPWRTSDLVRKVISKSKGEEQFMKFRQMFIDGCVELKTVPREKAGEIFDELKHFGSYGFNKSHAAEYSLIAYWDAWLKVHYPLEFIASLLSYGPAEPRKTEHFNEAKRLGIKVLLPHINISDSKIWKVDDDNNLRIPFLEIKGLGPITATHIVETRDEGGPFASLDDFLARVDKRKCNIRIQKILTDVGAFDDNSDIQDDEMKLHAISELFPFNLSNDPMYLIRPMLQLILDNSDFELSKVKGLLGKHGKKDRKRDKYYFGYMSNIKYGYREKVQQNEKAFDFSGLGGVYGYIDDGDGYCMLAFGTNIYKKRKQQIEHCSDKWLLVKAANPYDRESLYCNHDVWFEEDLVGGDLSGLGLNCAKKVRIKKDDYRKLLESVESCEACKLRSECSKPVPSSIGEFNMSIVGEAPGREEDKLGVGFVGASGEVLFKRKYSLMDYGLGRELFHITNVCKCWPRQSGKPKPVQVKACSAILDEELKLVKPFIILALGNTAVKYFRGEDSGINALNSTTEWSDKHKCWIHWALHPAATLHNPENVDSFRTALKSFADKVSVLGFGL